MSTHARELCMPVGNTENKLFCGVVNGRSVGVDGSHVIAGILPSTVLAYARAFTHRVERTAPRRRAVPCGPTASCIGMGRVGGQWSVKGEGSEPLGHGL